MVEGRQTASADADERRAESTQRLCAATRAQRPSDELIRFVAGPDGVIVPDLARRLPGRGVWVTAERAAVAAAAKSRAFAKSLKRKVDVPEDLAELVERLLVRRVVEALSLANKAGLVVTGFEKVDTLVARGEAAALIHGCDAAVGGRDKLDRKLAAVSRAAGCQPRIVDVLSIEQLSLAMGRTNVVHAALIHGGATDRLLSEAERLVRYRCGSCSTTDSD